MTAAVATWRLSSWRRIGWLHPEWWSLALCAAAWLIILLMASPVANGVLGSHGHGNHATVAAMSPNISPIWTTELLAWLVMIVAMMFPIVLGPIRLTAARSLWRRRHRAIVGFLTGYIIPWMLFGIVASLGISALKAQTQLQPEVAAAFGFGAALLWQITPRKRRALFTCHRTLPIAPSGWRADRDCLRYGWMVGGSCLVSCWALMLACMLSGHSLAAMICATAVGWTERNRPLSNQRLLCGVIAVFGVAYGTLAFV